MHDRDDKNFILQSLELKLVRDDLMQRNESLLKQLMTNRIFLNMVIHHMRNPCNSAAYGILESLDLIRESTDDLFQFNQNLKQSLVLKSDDITNDLENTNENIFMTTILNPDILNEKIQRSKTLRKEFKSGKF